MKYILIALIALCTFLPPAAAESIVWEGKYARATQQGGMWLVKDPMKGNVQFAHCETRNGAHGKGIYCHSRQQGNIQVQVDVNVANTNDDTVGNEGTTYAVFNPKNFRKYLPEGQGNICNVTDGGPSCNGMKNLCTKVGAGNCILVVAPLHDWNAAVAIAKRQTGWDL